MVRAAERTVAVELLLMIGQKRTQRPYFDQFVFGQRRQNAGQPLGKHGLARSRRTHHQKAVSARGGDFQSKAGGVLTFDIDEIRQFGVFRRPLRNLAVGLRQRFDAVQMGGDLT